MTNLSNFILGGGRMKKLIQVLIVFGIFVVMGGTAQGMRLATSDEEKEIESYCEVSSDPIACKARVLKERSLIDVKNKEEVKKFEELLNNAMKGIKPEIQKEFLNIVKTHADKYAKGKSEIKKSLYRKKRIKAFTKYFNESMCFHNWVGTVRSLDTDKNGDAMLGIDIGGYIFLNYGVQKIPMSNSLFDTVAEMEENDKVVLSGCFKKHIDTFADNWYLWTHETTEKGAMTSPTFQGSYSDIKKIN
jgi:hypothetical protein